MLAFWLDAHAPRWRSVVPLSVLRAALGSSSVDSRANYYQDKPIRLPAPGGGTVVNAQYAACAWLMSPLAVTVLPMCVAVVLVALAAVQVLAVFVLRALTALLQLAPDLTVNAAGDDDDEDAAAANSADAETSKGGDAASSEVEASGVDTKGM